MKNLIKDLESLNRHDTLDATDHELIAKVIEVLKAQDSRTYSRDIAETFLCDNDELEGDSIDAQVKLIAEHCTHSPKDLIDNIEGVIVWEKVVNEFTCKEFLTQILYR